MNKTNEKFIKVFGSMGIEKKEEKAPAKYMFTQERSDYLTPGCILADIFADLENAGINCEGRFDLDVCCTQKNIPAKRHYIDGETDGLKADWCGVSYCNPPYKECDKWVKKAFAEFEKGVVCVLLIPARPETKYWQQYLLKNGRAEVPYIDIKFLRKGLRFLNPDTHEEMGVFKNPLAIVIMNGMANACYELIND